MHWRIPFLITGVLSAIWVVMWLRTYKNPEAHPKLSKAELAYIESDSEEESLEKLPWKSVVVTKQAWAFALAKVTDAVWWFYLFWGAIFLAENFGVKIKEMGLPFLVIYLMADGGSILGGWRPDKAIAVENARAYNQYIDKLSKASDIEINSYKTLHFALNQRHDFFASVGCKLSDHGLERFHAEDFTDTEKLKRYF